MADLFSILDGAAADTVAPFVVVELPGKPRAMGRPRSRVVIPRKGRPFVQVYTDPVDAAYQQAVAWKAKAAMRGKNHILEGPVAIRVFAMLPVPASWPQKKRDAALAGQIFPTSRPDDDNYAKFRDALNGIVWRDDAQVCRSLTVKEYCENPGLIIEVYQIL